jgi:type IV pilus assembly protein PilV
MKSRFISTMPPGGDACDKEVGHVRHAGCPSARARWQAGVGLIEVLVALLVLSVGILAIIGMQISGKQANYDAVQRTTAAHLAMDLVERMRANPSELDAYVTDAVLGGGSLNAPDPSCDSDADTCTAAEMAEADLYQWEQQMDGAAETREEDGETRNSGGLVSPLACLTEPPGGGAGLYTLTIVWRGAGELAPTDIEGCDDGLNGTDLYGTAAAPTSDLYRRAATITFFVTI